jgi:hypothetical protein
MKIILWIIKNTVRLVKTPSIKYNNHTECLGDDDGLLDDQEYSQSTDI